MKQHLFILLFLFSCLQIWAETRIPSRITEATVYRSGAKLTNVASVRLTAGSNQIVFEKLPVDLNPNSIQVRIEGKADLLSAFFRRATIELNQPNGSAIKALQDSIETVNDRILRLVAENEILNKEESSLQDNQKRVGAGENSTLSVNDWKEMTQYYRTRLTEIKNRQLEITFQRRKEDRLMAGMNERLRKFNHRETQTLGEIVLQIESATAQTLNISCVYFITQAYWTPAYDLRAEAVDKPLRMVYKAVVSQQSGFDWQAVKLKLSSARPLSNNNRPILTPQYVDYYVARPIRDLDDGLAAGRGNVYNLSQVRTEDRRDMAKPSSGPGDLGEVVVTDEEVVLEESASGEEFEITAPQSIVSGAEPQTVRYKEEQMDAIYQYHAVPKMDPGVFLLAKIPNYGRYGLLSGTAQIFFKDTYVGQSEIDTKTVSDTLLLSLGRDEDISIKRVKPTDLAYTPKFLNNFKRELVAYDIVVKNNKKIPVNIEILDQIPVSKQDDITVELEEKSGAQYSADFGKLLWHLEVPAYGSKTLRFKYWLKYPKDRTVAKP
ncbi:MAG: DUF4139 domain-containing protein [Haliscomenobacter sp.]|uniref:DUF4139 domain-containing protein n=1 Tax=Haliscomenobacter sp. TaxID=2717303 RepID=UPI00299F948B|nr:DUF4139 domain-containing protein [Haliscomenobacter sp.]MDX2071703.1 DUF4139 domain-containing protein [Haliscomenobacter sp.]